MCVFYRIVKKKPPADFVSGDTSRLLTPPGFFSWQPNVTNPAARVPPPPPPHNNQYVQSSQTPVRLDQTSVFSEYIRSISALRKAGRELPDLRHRNS